MTNLYNGDFVYDLTLKQEAFLKGLEKLFMAKLFPTIQASSKI